MSSVFSDSPIPTAFNPETCLRRGHCSVPSQSKRRRHSNNFYELKSHSIYYEQHGAPGSDPLTGAKHKILFIMGLNSSCFSWGRQVKHFAARGDLFTALVLDNRGVGNSGYPAGPYKTSSMAEDIISLLDDLGWTGERDVNVVGISLGGMIAQELAYRIPHRIASLLLAVTTPGGWTRDNFTPWRGVLGLTALTFTGDPLRRAAIALGMLFPKKWLNERATSDPYATKNGNLEDSKMGSKTNYDVQKEAFLLRVTITKVQKLKGCLFQMVAALTHSVSPERLAHIAANIPKIVILTGDEDCLVDPRGSDRIKAGMDGALDRLDEEDLRRVEFLKWEATGHAVHLQRDKEFNELVERCVRESRELIDRGWKGRNV